MPEARRLLLATRSSGKLRELEPLVRGAGLAPVTLADLGLSEQAEEDALEAYTSFADNAMAKAAYFFERAGGLPVLAEDSGLCVTALGGAPGVHSKRWGGESGLSGAALDRHNVERILEAVRGAEDRSARFVCSAVVVWSGGAVAGDGETVGRLLEARCGEGGFGYDPVFWSSELSACFGLVSAGEKARVSHRSRAVHVALAQYVKASRTDFSDAS